MKRDIYVGNISLEEAKSKWQAALTAQGVFEQILEEIFVDNLRVTVIE